MSAQGAGVPAGNGGDGVSAPAPRPPAFPPPTRVRWHAGRVTLTGTVAAARWQPAQHTYQYDLTDVRGAAITTATMFEPALHPAPPHE